MVCESTIHVDNKMNEAFGMFPKVNQNFFNKLAEWANVVFMFVNGEMWI